MVPTGRHHKSHSECHNQFIGNASVDWPPWSCDLKPLDYLLWGYVKSMVYANKPAIIYELYTNTEREIAAVPADLRLKIVKNWVQRLHFCKRVRGLPCKRNRVSFIMASNVLLLL